MGVEEELLLVDPDTGILKPVSDHAIRLQDCDDSAYDLEQELFLQQIETATEPCSGLDDLTTNLQMARRTAVDAVRAAGAEAVAMPVPVIGDHQAQVTPKARYQQMLGNYGEIGRRAVVCGMHVHVDVESDDEAVGVVDHIRPWLPLLMAAAANSPFYDGDDTGHASWRSNIWDRWPSAGPTEPFGSVQAYRRAVDQMVASGAALDEAMVYFDVRLAVSYPTVELRVADVCTDLDTVVLVAALSRALVETAARSWSTGMQLDPWRVDLLRSARWRASHDGLSDQLLNPATMRLVPARAAFDSLLEHVGPALDESGDAAYVTALIDKLFTHGTGADRQRAVAGHAFDLAAVVEDLRARTAASLD